MALVHEFGIINDLSQVSYLEYAPEKYHCISVSDNHILPLLESLFLMRTYFNSLDRPEYGLAYYGTTLIPPESLSTFLDIILSFKSIKQQDDIIELSRKIIQAKKENKYMIHYGI
ncbi:hypothetical protein [Candidatus Enterococcus ferrettii]|uniref:Short-chain dehydrogenase n=1 Tax=Candidatus Enterococcus ferrettii TaxID=2815324 RepID=A0ABV0ET99_9ENTE|nr:hypothetical protein [Enterococcus sp. 665A]MBO1340234.1 hypothetical protein [Enterococcus sp. 665A]